MGKRANSTFAFTFTNGVMAWTGPDGRGIKIDLNIFPVYKTLDDFDKSVYDNGMKQKVADAMALPKDTETGKPAPLSEKIAAGQRVVDALNQRSWTAGRESPNVGFVTEVLKRAFPKRDYTWVRTQVAAMSAAELAALVANPPAQLKSIVDAIKAERTAVLTKDVDTAALFKKLADLK